MASDFDSDDDPFADGKVELMGIAVGDSWSYDDYQNSLADREEFQRNLDILEFVKHLDISQCSTYMPCFASDAYQYVYPRDIYLKIAEKITGDYREILPSLVTTCDITDRKFADLLETNNMKRMTIQEFEIEAANANLYIESQISDWIAYIDSLSPDVLIGMKNPYREYSYGYYGTLSTELQHASKMYARKTDRDYSRIVIKCDPTKCNMTLDEAKKYFNDSYIDQIILFRYRNNTIKFEYNIDDVNADIADRRARTYEYAAKKHMYVARDDVKNFEIFANACTYANIDCNKITTTIKQIYDIDVHGSQDMYAILHAISISDMMSIIDDCTMVANV